MRNFIHQLRSKLLHSRSGSRRRGSFPQERREDEYAGAEREDRETQSGIGIGRGIYYIVIY